MISRTHDYRNLGGEYAKTRFGSPKFIDFMIDRSGIAESGGEVVIVELGAGSGQQTALLDSMLQKSELEYRIYAYDKSYNPGNTGEPGQLNILRDLIKKGRVSSNVIPIHFDFDGKKLMIPSNPTNPEGHVYSEKDGLVPISSETVDFCYLAFVYHHLKHQEKDFKEIHRILKSDGSLFVYGAAREDARGHPLHRFFPSLEVMDSIRYHPRSKLMELFNKAGFTYEKHCSITRDKNREINRNYLEGVKSLAVNSGLIHIKKENPAEFKKGVKEMQTIVEESEKTGIHETFDITRSVYWGTREN